jgi:hypothetical protein
MGENGVLVFPDAAKGAASSIDPNLLLALQNGGGFGGNGSWIWILFLWMMWQNGGYNGYRNNGGSFQDLAAQINGNEGRQYLAEIMGGRFDNLGQLAQIVNTGVETVKNGIFSLQNAINTVGSQVGMSGLQVQNAIQAGNAALSQQLCSCCCDNKVAILNQTNALQSQMATNHAASTLQSAQNQAATQLQMAQIESADQLAVCRQTNELSTQAANNTRTITDAIAQQSIMINDKFCDLEKRELQNKINLQGDVITQLRGEISNTKQTEALNQQFNALNAKFAALEARQPNTVPVVWPNLQAYNATPNVGFNPWGYGFGGTTYSG